MTFKHLGTLALLASVFTGAGLRGVAQTATDGAVGGTVVDASGSGIPNAKVLVHSNKTNAEQTVSADGSGYFRVIHLQPAIYTVTITAEGFKEYKAPEVTVEVGLLTDVSPKLPVVGSNTVVEVTSEAPALNTVSPDFGGNIPQAVLQDVPVSNYRWSAYAAMTPGVVIDNSGFGLLSFRGQSTLLNNVTIDGADDNQAYFSEERGRTRAGYSTAKASIQEFQVNTSNYSTEFGRAAGGVVNSVTKSGGNKFHGELYFFDRDAEWGAFNNYALINLQNSSGAFVSTHVKPTDKRKQYGGAISGPIWKDKIFFFFAGDRFDHNFPAVAVASQPANLFTLPDATLPAGKACGGTGTAAPSTIDATACSLQTNLKLATYDAAAANYTSGVAGLNSMLGTVPRKGLQDIFFPKIDWQINGKNHASFEFNRLRWTSPAGIQTGLTSTNGIRSFGNDDVRVSFLIARLQSAITNNLSNEIRYQYGRDFEFEFNQTPTAYEQTNLVGPVAGYTNPFGLPPSVTITNLFTFGTANFLNRAALPDERRWQVADTANFNRGSHNIKFGVDFLHTNDLVNNLFSGFGVYSYSSLLNYFTDLGLSKDATNNTASAYKYSSFVQGFGAPGLEFQTKDYALFAEDNWKASKRLTLTYGLRWEYEQLPQPFSALINPELPMTANHPSSKSNIGPRVGFAFDLFGDGKTIVRGGYGMFFARILNGTIYNSLINTGVAAGQYTVSDTPTSVAAPTFPKIIAGGALSGTPNVVFFDPNFKAPQIHQTDLTIQRDLGHNMVASVTYLGAFGRRLANFTDLNLNAPTTVNYTIVDPSGKGPYAAGTVVQSKFYAKKATTSGGAACASGRDTPPTGVTETVSCKYGSLTDIFSGSNSDYEGVVVQVEKRFSHHFSVNSHYTFSHALDYGENNQTATVANNLLDPQNLRAEYGNSLQNTPNRFVLTSVMTTPWKYKGVLGRLVNDFEAAPSFSAGSGLPYSMTTSGTPTTAAAIGGGTLSAIGGGVNASNGTFRVPGIARNAFRQPSVNVLDLRISKRFAITETMKLELLGESFNILNHQNVTAVNALGYTVAGNAAGNTLTFNTQTANPTVSQFGAVTSTNSSNFSFAPRQIQVAARLQF